MSAAHLRPIPTDPSELVRYRCPADAADALAQHLAFDVRIPLDVRAFRQLPTRCVCGVRLHHWITDRPAAGPAQTGAGGR